MQWPALLAALVLAAALPFDAAAQAPGVQRAKGPPRGAPAHAAPRPAAPPAMRPPAVHAPPPAVRSVAPRPAPIVRAPQPRFQRPAMTARPPQAPHINRTVRRQQPARQMARPSATTTRQVQRQERARRQQENRALRRLPAAQRAVRRQEFQRAREQRAQQRLRPQGTPIQGQAAIRPNVTSAPRRNGQPRIAAQAARQGRFAAPFMGGGNIRPVRAAYVAPRRAWHRGLRAAFVPWYGPVFWPYAYSDIFDYTFWPDGYDDGYWAYAYDDFLDGVFWGEEGPPEEYAYAPGVERPAPTAPRYATVQELCRDPGTGITAWPFADIEKKVGLNNDQIHLLAAVKKAGQDASAAFKASCPPNDAFPLTPVGRVEAMTLRLQATLQAVQTVRPPLATFYDALSDEQKERFNELGPKDARKPANDEAKQAQDAQSCKQPKEGLSNLPIEKIEDAVKPTDAQMAGLNSLQDATTKAVAILQAACPDEIPLTPPGRLEMMEKRLTAMIDAANTVKPALASFYGSLTNEQKARFNRIGRILAQSK